MEYTVCYLDDQAAAVSVNASSPELAARQFRERFPRADTSQITVESISGEPGAGTDLWHYRACDLLHSPAPPDDVGEGELSLHLKNSHGPDPFCEFVLSGSASTFAKLGQQLLARLQRQDGAAGARLYSVPLLPGASARVAQSLAFEVRARLARPRRQPRALRLLWILLRLLVLAFAFLGVRTVLRGGW